jgi:hypothetical protein
MRILAFQFILYEAACREGFILLIVMRYEAPSHLASSEISLNIKRSGVSGVAASFAKGKQFIISLKYLPVFRPGE